MRDAILNDDRQRAIVVAMVRSKTVVSRLTRFEVALPSLHFYWEADRMDRGEHVPVLDGLRALAALLVVYAHMDKEGFTQDPPMATGSQGVLMFFTLSGFLMSHLYLWKPCDGGALLHFAVARLSRVIPLFITVVTGAFVASRLIGPEFVYFLTPDEYVRELLMIGSRHVFWSIPPEVEFYAVFAGLWWALRRFGFERCFIPVTALLAVVMLFRPIFPGITVFSHIHIFMAGAFMGAIRPTFLGRQPRAAIIVIQMLFVIAIVALVCGFPSREFFFRIGWNVDSVIYGTAAVAIGYGIVILAFSFRTPLADALLANDAMRAIGAWSFSLYLLHEPVMRAVHDGTASLPLPMTLRYALALGCALGAAKLSNMMIERPGQRLVRSWALEVLHRLEMRRENRQLRGVGATR